MLNLVTAPFEGTISASLLDTWYCFFLNIQNIPRSQGEIETPKAFGPKQDFPFYWTYHTVTVNDILESPSQDPAISNQKS